MQKKMITGIIAILIVVTAVLVFVNRCLGRCRGTSF